MVRHLISRRGAMRLAAVTTVAAALALSACSSAEPETEQPNSSAGGTWNSVVEAAKQEGSLSVYALVPPEQMQALVDAFQEEYPEITVTATRMGTEMLPKLDQEIAGNIEGAEVILGIQDVWYADNKDNLLDISDVPAAADWSDWAEEDYLPSLTRSPLGIMVWNTDKVPDGLGDWDDYLAPSLKGKIGMRESMSSTLASYMQFLEDTQGEDFLEGLAKQQPRFYPGSVVPMMQAVASGEVSVATMGALSTLIDLKAQGAPIDWKIPTDTWASQQVVAVLKKAEHKNAAKLFIEFAMSEKGQEAYVGGGMAWSPIGAPGSLDMDGMNVTLLDPKKTTTEAIAAWDARFKEIFDR